MVNGDSVDVEKWWSGNEDECYWMEITDRPDLGADLNAPRVKDDGSEYWGYTLITRARAGDRVFHYHKRSKAIVATSIISGEAWEESVVWGARGATARGMGVKPYMRPGWRRGLVQFQSLEDPVSLEDLRRHEAALLKIRDSLGDPPLYLPFEFSARRPLRPSQPYFAKLPAEMVALFPALAGCARTGATLNMRKDPAYTVGTSYREADEGAGVSDSEPFSRDPEVMERSLRSHRATQNSLAAFLTEHGVAPLSPRPSDPPFDLAWSLGDDRFVAEVKSLSSTNEEKQLRLGLGQVLRYRDQLGDEWLPVLVAEREPSDSTWTTSCMKVGVQLVWPAEYPLLLDRG